MIDATFIMNSVLLGVALAMDAFTVSVANGLNEPDMRKGRMCLIAGTYAAFQFIMPMTGWFCVHTLTSLFTAVQKYIPWIAFGLLLWIGINMLRERGEAASASGTEQPTDASETKVPSEQPTDASGTKVPSASPLDAAGQSGPAVRILGWSTLIMQGVATSIDALSVGFTIEQYGAGDAFVCCLIIAAVTFLICMGGLLSGKAVGKKLSRYAGVLGGIILIGIGLEILIRSFFA